MTHIESRPSRSKPDEEYDFYVDCECAEQSKEEVTSKLSAYATNVTLHVCSPKSDEGKSITPPHFNCMQKRVLLTASVGHLWLLQCLGFLSGFGNWTSALTWSFNTVLNSTRITQ